MAVDIDKTEKLKLYFYKNGLRRDQKFTNRQQRQIALDNGCSSFDLAEFIMFGVVNKVVKEQ